MTKILTLICARKNSTEVKNKNLINYQGKTLIEQSIFHAKKLKKQFDNRIVFSTDSKIMAKIAQRSGTEVPFIRPKKLAKKNSAEWLVWRHALKYLRDKYDYFPDIFLSLSPTAPFRRTLDVIRCIHAYKKSKKDIVVTVHKSKNNPYFNMLEKNSYGNYIRPKKLKRNIFVRQDCPKVFSMNTVAYVVNPNFILKKNNMFEGNIGTCEIEERFSLDLDTLYEVNLLKKLSRK